VSGASRARRARRAAALALGVAGGALAACARPAPAPAPLNVEAAAAERLLGDRARFAARPRTRAERSGYRETSRYADVAAFLDTLGRLAPAWCACRAWA
jgi:hypothetical protein